MQIQPPDINSKRSRFADWLEILALSNSQGSVSLSALSSHVRKATDDRASASEIDADADTDGEPEITGRLTEDLIERVSEELELRAETVGNAYPFELDAAGKLGTAMILKRKTTWSDATSGELIYCFCLLDSGIRDHVIAVSSKETSFVTRIGSVFQVCACIAVGGYTNATVVSFGFPRALGNGFLPALTATWAKYGSYKIMQSIPYGFDASLKDGGVDIVAWRAFPDGHAATLIMFVQVASGMDWKNKAVSDDVRSVRNWFVGERFEHFLPAICIPFPLWFDLEDPPKNATGQSVVYNDGVKRRFAYREAKFGVIFDRGRIALSTAEALRASDSIKAGIEGLDRIKDIESWVFEVLDTMLPKGVVS